MKVVQSPWVEKALVKMRRHGLGNTVYQSVMKMVNHAVDFRVLRGVVVERADPAFLKTPPPYRALLLDEPALRRFAQDPANEMSHPFIDDALARGDQCFAICQGEGLAAYGWYSFGATPIGLPGMVLRYGSDWVYMYKGFTHEQHRGRRLHAIGMTTALAHYLRRGYKGMVSYVDSVNFDSLKSCLRMGYSIFGSICVARVAGRYYAWSSPGCAPYQFRLEHEAESQIPARSFG